MNASSAATSSRRKKLRERINILDLSSGHLPALRHIPQPKLVGRVAWVRLGLVAIGAVGLAVRTDRIDGDAVACRAILERGGGERIGRHAVEVFGHEFVE